MDLDKALKSDSHTFNEVKLYLEIVRHTLERFKENCPITHDYLCAEASSKGQLTLSESSQIVNNAIDILNTELANQTTTVIALPKDWRIPRFQFGQLTKQGVIVGMNYHPRISPDGNDGHWVYSVQAFATRKLQTIEEFEI